MFPQGIIWQNLRQRALSSIPQGAYVPRTSPPTLAEWLRTGAFTVSSSAPRSFDLAVSPNEIGAALFSDAAFHLDHACEHSVTVRDQLSSGRWYSAAWMCVTFYYWSFFLAVSITRMVGYTGLFLGKPEVDSLVTLSGSPTNAGPGAYVLQCGSPTTLSQLTVNIKKAGKSRLHDLIWRMLADEIKNCALYGRSASADQKEMRLFNALSVPFNKLGDVWPSDLRNLVNYAPGAGYGTILKRSTVDAFGIVSFDPPSTFDEILDRLEDSGIALSRGAKFDHDLRATTRLLVDLTFSLDAIVRALHADIILRRKIDLRWPNARDRFFVEKFKGYKSPNWPSHA